MCNFKLTALILSVSLACLLPGAAAQNSATFEPVPSRRAAPKTAPHRGFTPLTVTTVPDSPFKAAPAPGAAYASITYCSAWDYSENPSYGVFRLPLSGSPTTFRALQRDENLVGNAGAVFADGKYFSAKSWEVLGQVISMDFYVYDSSTWQLLSHMPGDANFKAMDMTCDPVTGRIYGSFVNRAGGYYYFGTFNLTTGATVEIANYGQAIAFTGLASAPDGQLFGITVDGALYSIDKSTGAYSLIGDTGLATTYTTSATIDPTTGKMYYAVAKDGAEALWSIDTATASATKVYDMPDAELISGLYIPGAATPAGAPSMPADMTVTFPDGALSGSVTFTVPSTTYGGSAASGQVTYTVSVDGTETATGQAQCGATVTEAVNVSEAGDHTVAVTLANEAGTGPMNRENIYVGHDIPTPVSNVAITYGDGAFTITWDPASALHGGYMNSEGLTYTVVRNPDNVTVATGIKNTTFTDPVENGAGRIGYTYSVYPTYRGYSADAVTSNIIYIGHIVPPFTEDFSQKEAMDDFTIINANGDDRTWQWENGAVRTNISTRIVTDDYLVLPPVMLEKGKSYDFTFDARCQLAKYAERFAAYAGTAPTVEGLAIELIPPTETTSETYERQSARFTPSETGLYYFAVKGCSEIDRYWLWIDNVSVTAPIEAALPAAPAELTVTPAPQGVLSATISFKAPEIDLAGTRLTALDKVELLRGEEVIATFHPGPGETVNYTDNSPVNGQNTYTAVAWNSAGRGLTSEKTAYIGIYVPQPVAGVKVSRTATEGETFIEWQRVTADIQDNPLSESTVKYNVIRYDGYGTETTVAQGITATSVTDHPLPQGTVQDFAQYYVVAEDAAGISSESWSNAIAVGTPYPSPWHESWANGLSSNLYGIDRPEASTATWRLVTDQTQPGVTAHDGDNGYLMFEGNSMGEEATIFSGLIDLSGLKHPALQLYYNAFGASNTLDILINCGDGEGYVSARKVEMQGETNGWTRILVSLESYKGQQIQWAVKGTLDTHRTNVIDDISIISVPEINAAISDITAPIRTAIDESAVISVKVENAGVNTFSGHEVTLWCDGEAIVTLPGTELESGMSETVAFDFPVNAMSPRDMLFFATVELADDEIESDNTSDQVTVRTLPHAWPSPSGISAEVNASGATLSWNAPSLDFPEPVETTDGAEDYFSFSTGLPNTTLVDDNIGEWTMVDGDGLYTIGIGTGNTLMPNATLPMAFQVFCADDGGLQGEAWIPRTGRKMFVAFSGIAMSGDNECNDDWMISPKLTGRSQGISFYGRSATDLYGLESMEVLYSMGSLDPEDFESLDIIGEVPVEWTEYSYRLPEGTQYFAIRCTSANRFALCIDDITFTPGGLGAKGLELQGYNIYRDSKRLNTEPLALPVFHDPEGMAMPHTYHVTALYNLGESSPSDPFLLDPASISGITASPVEVAGMKGSIAVTGAAGLRVAVIRPDGVTIFSANGTPDMRISARPGIYIVNIGNSIFRVLVR